MEKPSRRRLLKSVAAGGVAAAGLGPMLSASTQSVEQDHGRGHDRPLEGRRAQATVSFGQWDADPARPFDRFPLNSDRTRNVHKVLPFEVEIEEGGAVSFIISGVHQILVYDDGRELEDVRTAAFTVGSIIPGGPGLIEYPIDRVYRGLDPRVLTYATLSGDPPAPTMVQDRVESVNFATAGRYLVVCGVVPHFKEGMHGYVTVKQNTRG